MVHEVIPCRTTTAALPKKKIEGEVTVLAYPAAQLAQRWYADLDSNPGLDYLSFIKPGLFFTYLLISFHFIGSTA